jgi:hypothetical protein
MYRMVNKVLSNIDPEVVQLAFADKPNLLISLVKCMHVEFEGIPLELFCDSLIGQEEAVRAMIWEHNIPILMKRGNPEFVLNQKSANVIVEQVSDLIREKLVPSVSKETWKKARAPIHERDIPRLLLTQANDGNFLVSMHNLLSRIDPDWKKQVMSSTMLV